MIWHIETGESHYEKIECPECGFVQDAMVEHTLPFASYVHDCIKCGYTIMESEWNRIATDKNELI